MFFRDVWEGKRAHSNFPEKGGGESVCAVHGGDGSEARKG